MMNRTLKLLMISDIFIAMGFGLIDPILAIFFKDNLEGGTIFAAGLASALFLVTRSLVQLPFSRYVDKHDDKVRWLMVGTLLMSTIPFLYIFTTHIKYVYLAQIIHGIGVGLAFPTWLGLWSTHLDKKQESFEWSLYSTSTGIGIAVTATIGSAIAQFVGFEYTFILAGIMSLVGCFILLGLERKKEKALRIHSNQYHTKRKLSYHKKHA